MSNSTSTSMPSRQQIPAEALPAAICVLAYSFLCLFSGCLLIHMLIRSKERFTYAYFYAIGTSLVTVLSMIQQIFYIIQWRDSKIGAWEAAIEPATNGHLGIGSHSDIFITIMYWIQTYLFGANAMIILFWAVALATSAWECDLGKLNNYRREIGTCSKFAAFVLPLVSVIVRAILNPRLSTRVGVIANNVILMTSFTIGALCVFSVIVRCVRTYLRFKVTESTSLTINEVTPWETDPRTPGRPSPRRRSSVDTGLMLRFSMAFVIFTGFNVCLVLYNIGSVQGALARSSNAAPDFSIHTAIRDCLDFIPTVTSSLLAFCLFGTTDQARQHYSNLIRSLRRETRETKSHHALPYWYGSNPGSREHSLDLQEYAIKRLSGKSFFTEEYAIKRFSAKSTFFTEEYELRSGSLMPIAQLETAITITSVPTTTNHMAKN
ncbi:hypothetical protein K461DRAFT_272558 [Myriangium duriaei CBS 260.36]|uniref:Uncharacterized protein n=1 Tax=Myriangium duriaei CBS 260.36 TaxID=1168546 RepID=A0A9P4MFG1_9PEZI|nr:hypothetical protein K461DRAFT_272558 [Myriangium duriaei CBS 260.36]